MSIKIKHYYSNVFFYINGVDLYKVLTNVK